MTGPSCAEVVEAMSSAADGEATGLDDEAVRDHLEGCPTCRHFGTELRSLEAPTVHLVASLDPAALEAVGAAWSESVVERRNRRPPSAPPWSRAAAAFAPVAVALALVLGTGHHTSAPHVPPPSPCTSHLPPGCRTGACPTPAR